jgi:hypothetical protein
VADLDPIFFIPNSGSKLSPYKILIKEFNYFNHQKAKKWFLSFKNMILVVHPGSGLLIFSHPGSMVQGSKRHTIPDPDPQLWF